MSTGYYSWNWMFGEMGFLFLFYSHHFTWKCALYFERRLFCHSLICCKSAAQSKMDNGMCVVMLLAFSVWLWGSKKLDIVSQMNRWEWESNAATELNACFGWRKFSPAQKIWSRLSILTHPNVVLPFSIILTSLYFWSPCFLLAHGSLGLCFVRA